MVGLMQEAGTFKYRMGALEDDDECRYIEIKPSHFHRLAISVRADRRRALNTRCYLVPPGSEFRIDTDDVDIRVDLTLTHDGREALQIFYPGATDHSMVTITNVPEWEFQRLIAVFSNAQEEEGVNLAGDKLACVFCDKDGKVQAEGFAPECDECAEEAFTPQLEE